MGDVHINQSEQTIAKNRSNTSIALIVGGAIATIFKVALALNTYGTNDVLVYEQYLATAKMQGPANLYKFGVELKNDEGVYHRERFWMPPFIVNYLLSLDRLATTTGLPFRVWLRLVSALADCVSLFLLHRLASISASQAWLIALSPPAILISGFHGNTDPLMISFLLASVLLLERYEKPGWGGILFGMSCAVKAWPILFALSLLFSLRGWRRQAWFTAAASASWITAGLPHIIMEPHSILTNVMAYRGTDMVWGIRFFAKLMFPIFDRPIGIYGPASVGMLSILAAIWFARGNQRLHVRVGLIALGFLIITPGFGFQYLIWATPALVMFTPKELAIYGLLGGCFLFATYYIYSNDIWLTNTLNRDHSLLSITLGVFTWMYLSAVGVRLARVYLKAPDTREPALTI